MVRRRRSKRVAAGLLKIAVDFGLLRGSVRKEFASYHLPDELPLPASRDADENAEPRQGRRIAGRGACS